MITQNDYAGFPEFVIVRGFRDRPAKLKPVAVRGTVVDVVGSDPSLPMPQPVEYAFRFTEHTFDRLSSAFEREDHALLTELWAEAEAAELPESAG